MHFSLKSATSSKIFPLVIYHFTLQILKFKSTIKSQNFNIIKTHHFWQFNVMFCYVMLCYVIVCVQDHKRAHAYKASPLFPLITIAAAQKRHQWRRRDVIILFPLTAWEAASPTIITLNPICTHTHSFDSFPTQLQIIPTMWAHITPFYLDYIW